MILLILNGANTIFTFRTPKTEVELVYITRFTSLEKKCPPLILCKKKLVKFEKNTSQLFRVSIHFGEIKSKVNLR